MCFSAQSKGTVYLTYLGTILLQVVLHLCAVDLTAQGISPHLELADDQLKHSQQREAVYHVNGK